MRERTSLTGAQHRDRAGAARRAEELGDHLRVERRPSRRHTRERLDELAHVSDAVLQQIADPRGVVGQEL